MAIQHRLNYLKYILIKILNPLQVWLTEDMHFFSANGVVLKGYESWIDTLTVIQEYAGVNNFLQQSNQYSASIKETSVDHSCKFVSLP